MGKLKLALPGYLSQRCHQLSKTPDHCHKGTVEFSTPSVHLAHRINKLILIIKPVIHCYSRSNAFDSHLYVYNLQNVASCCWKGVVWVILGNVEKWWRLKCLKQHYYYCFQNWTPYCWDHANDILSLSDSGLKLLIFKPCYHDNQESNYFLLLTWF